MPCVGCATPGPNDRSGLSICSAQMPAAQIVERTLDSVVHLEFCSEGKIAKIEYRRHAAREDVR